MRTLTVCPCCSTPMLHHLKHGREYWFCRHCWQEMPDLEATPPQAHRLSKIINLSPKLPVSNHSLLTT